MGAPFAATLHQCAPHGPDRLLDRCAISRLSLRTIFAASTFDASAVAEALEALP